ncbi:hypothetical protein EMPS_10335 [Entomortierella parvispora]|uniref:Uncharacterized protein n=1 Tax=Entomortierella parvispora TaxID=205924 RepID=A0A9P3HJW4_9FUNG|nr:hypothetical protein EMPS_10335 [Entomortierella parvispora]
MSNPLLDLPTKDELISKLLKDDKAKPSAAVPVGERKTFKVQSDLLARLQDFLPKIKDANDQLDKMVKQDPKSVDIENVDEESGEQYIEMDLGLGVFDMKKDVTEDDIIINPKGKKPDETVKPTIVMMDLDKDVTKDAEEEGETDHSGDDDSNNAKIPSATTDKDNDVVMSS